MVGSGLQKENGEGRQSVSVGGEFRGLGESEQGALCLHFALICINYIANPAVLSKTALELGNKEKQGPKNDTPGHQGDG